jgi:hypothetical protein
MGADEAICLEKEQSLSHNLTASQEPKFRELAIFLLATINLLPLWMRSIAGRHVDSPDPQTRTGGATARRRGPI